MIAINSERLLQDLRELRSFGACGSGVVRESFTAVDMESRHWLLDKLQAAGLVAMIDGMGNVIGRAPDCSRAVLIGSHTDTQPAGGWLDGAMGVIYGLEIARAGREQHGAAFPVDVASWMDEEGRFLTCLGSRSFCGLLDPAELDAAVSPDGQSLLDARSAAGLAGRPCARLDVARQIGYLEGHIEQGPVLESLAKVIGVVTSIVGGAAFHVVLSGQQNHAGTTPMHLRQDAGMACIELAHAIHVLFQAIAGPDSVWTIGNVRFLPGAVNTIAGRSEFYLEFRDPQQAMIERFIGRLREVIRSFGETARVRVEIAPLGNPIAPAAMDERLQTLIGAAASRHAPNRWISMPSGAGHDAAMFAELIPTGMLFVPSVAGVSHAFEENTSDEDIARGCQVMAEAAAAFLQAAH